MSELIPPVFLFRMALPIRRKADLPRTGKTLLQLGKEFTLPISGELSQGANFGDIRIAWNESGLGFRVEVTGKIQPVRCEYGQILSSDGLQLWIDTRNTQNIHRASRFCHHFCILPTGSSRDRSKPMARQLPLARAKEEGPLCDPRQIAVEADVHAGGYVMEVWLPAEILHGYDPESNSRLGFYYLLRDQELGDQLLSVGPEFPFDHDPSLWWTLELV